ncbi:glycosyltransferase family 8 protein [Ceratobasidium sp. AG-Ba]|nr:glycosyltransferase family 8 protein [Ceratobasidium sp. AG-Ba]
MSKMPKTQKAWVTLITDKDMVPSILLSPWCRLQGLKVTGVYPKSGGYTGVEARFVDSWAKLRVFGLNEYERVVLIDSDMLCLKNMDELFDLPLEDQWIAASHACTCNPMRIPHYPSYWIPSNCGHTYAIPVEPGSGDLSTPLQPPEDSPPTFHSINSGIVVLKPSEDAINQLVHALDNDPKVTEYGFPDQDFLSVHFKNRIKFLGYEYNALKPMRRCHANLWRDGAIRNVHYIFKTKPWCIPKGCADLDDQFQELHNWWWDEWQRLKSEVEDRPWWRLVTKLVVEWTLNDFN